MTSALARSVRSAPATLVYLLALAATSAVLSLSGTQTGDRLLDAQSTNLHQLARVPLRVLVGSAFWIGRWEDFLVWVAILLVVIAPLERRLGWRRTTAVFAAGHLGATLLVAAGLSVALHLGVVDPRVARARDVGASYGILALAAFATYLLAPRYRLPYVAALAGVVLLALARSHTFTDFGHMSAVAIGFGCYGLARRSSTSGSKPWARG